MTTVIQGTGATITFESSGYTADLVSISAPQKTRSSVSTTTLHTPDAMTSEPADDYDPGEWSIEFVHDPEQPLMLTEDIETIVFTYPDGVTKVEFQGFVTNQGGGEFSNDTRVTTKIAIRVSEVNTTVSPGSSSFIFNGTNETLIVNDVASLNYEFNQPFSFHMRIYMIGSGTIISKWSGTSFNFNGRGYLVQYSSGIIRFYRIHEWQSGAGQVAQISTVVAAAPFAEWFDLTLTTAGNSSASAMKIYVNGIEQAVVVNRDTLNNNTMISTKETSLMSRYLVGQYTPGNYYDFAAFNIELTQAQVTECVNTRNLLNHSAVGNIDGYYYTDAPGNIIDGSQFLLVNAIGPASGATGLNMNETNVDFVNVPPPL